MKPREYKCKMYCKDYETCTLKDCNMRAKIVYDNLGKAKLEMRSARECNILDKRLEWRHYNEVPRLEVNGRHFKKGKI